MCNIFNKRLSKKCHWFLSENDICIHEHVIKPQDFSSINDLISNHVEADMKKHCVSPETKVIIEICFLGPTLGIPITLVESEFWKRTSELFMSEVKSVHGIHKHCGLIPMDFYKWISV